MKEKDKEMEMEKKMYLTPETEVVSIEAESMMQGSPDDVTPNSIKSISSASSGLGFGGGGNSSNGGSSARSNERNADGLNDWNINLW